MLELILASLIAGAPARTPEFPNVDEVCGTDRRCRLELLKAKNWERRRFEFQKVDERIERLERENEARKVENYRRDKPWVFTWDITRLGGLGGTFGYCVTSWFRGDLLFRWSPFGLNNWDDYYDPYDEGYSSGSVTGDVFWGGAGATFFPIEIKVLYGALSPFISAHFLMGWGHVQGYAYEYSYTYDEETDEYYESSNEEHYSAEARFHSVKFAAGINWQARLGLHIGLGFVFRHPVYVQARMGPGRYDEDLKEQLYKWHDDAARFDVVWQMGWAF